jgi:hypothetical protein
MPAPLLAKIVSGFEALLPVLSNIGKGSINEPCSSLGPRRGYLRNHRLLRNRDRNRPDCRHRGAIMIEIAIGLAIGATIGGGIGAISMIPRPRFFIVFARVPERTYRDIVNTAEANQRSIKREVLTRLRGA